MERGQTFLRLEWNQDQPDTTYRVRWLQEKVFVGEDNVSYTSTSFTRTYYTPHSQTTALTYTITNLMSDTQYTVMVCRQMVANDNCGNCDLCATTLQGTLCHVISGGGPLSLCPGPPAPPIVLNLQVNGADSITVNWLQEASSSVDNWHVLCVESISGFVAGNKYVIASGCGSLLCHAPLLQHAPGYRGSRTTF